MSTFNSPFQILGELRKDSKAEITPSAFIHMATSFFSAYPENYGTSPKSLGYSIVEALTCWMTTRHLCIKVEDGKLLFVEDK